MSINDFVKKDNISMLWEVISDVDNFKFLKRDIQGNIYQLFLNNIQGFFENEKINTNSLVEINKKYIMLILNYINSNFNIQPSKITIHQEPVKESITYEEIQNDRRNKFDRDLFRRQEDFDNFMTVKVPPVPEFSDKKTDSPIKGMDRILKEMQASRNYDIEQINRNQNSTTQVDNWLKSQETSLKSEKFVSETNATQHYTNSRFSFLNITDNETNEVTKDKKNVSFSNVQEIQTFDIDDEEDANIFLKLKTVSNKKSENIKLEIQEPPQTQNPPQIQNNFMDEDRIVNLEREVKNINIKMDKILELLTNHNKLGL